MEQEYLTQVTQVKHLTLDIIELEVQLVEPTELSYKAGQFMQFKIGNTLRCYSMVTPPIPDNPKLTFCIELLPKGLAADFIRQLKVGSELSMRGPLGFFLVEEFSQPIFFVATGVGIAPFAAMLPDILVRGYREQIHLLFGVHSEEDVFYYDRFNRLAKQYENFKFTPLLSRPQSHWPGETGHVTTYLEVSYPQLKDNVFYLCGGKSMISEVKDILLKLGHDPKKIKMEYF